ncbi:MAG: hypothetical protein LQ344_006130 [Seirophora lacunosa]|nr:MAG: hypothetical protein LQ344_006130 [Seirophora lacunosa]
MDFAGINWFTSMRYTAFFITLLFGALSTVFADEPPSSNVSTTAAARVGVIRKEDIGIVRKFQGRPIPDGPAIHLLSVVMLKLYHTTVEQRGDAKIVQYKSPHEGEHGDLVLEIRSFDRGPNMMSLGSSLYAVHFMLHSMLHPRRPSDGFHELEWQIIDRAISPGYDIPLGTVSLRIAEVDERKKLGVVPLVTDTDLVEALIGYIYYLLQDQSCGAVNITIVRPDSMGVKTPVGEIEIRGRQSAGSGDDGQVDIP